MRIAIAYHGFGTSGGTQTYLRAVIEGLVATGHEVAQWSEDSPRPFSEIERWHPDVIFSQGLWDPENEERLLAIAPGVLLAHTYLGTCISGEKTRKLPAPSPCPRQFGPACLAQYFPRRCGGLSPITWLTAYRLQHRRCQQLNRFSAILTLSEYMRREMAAHVIDAGRVHHVPFAPPKSIEPLPAPENERACHLVFSGRFHELKGGQLLLRALPSLSGRLQRDLRVTLMGDGPHRQAWEHEADRVRKSHPEVRIEFQPWMERNAAQRCVASATLLIFPSIWPEPFGLSGIEALQLGVPVVGFAVGAVPEWLIDGKNGHLAPACPPSAAGLADAIYRALSSPSHYFALRDGARHSASRFCKFADHVANLTELLRASR